MKAAPFIASGYTEKDGVMHRAVPAAPVKPAVAVKTPASGEKPVAKAGGALAPKYNNVRCEVSGEKFDSKLEAKVYERLCAEHGKGNVLRQVSLKIGKRRVRPDFMVLRAVHDDGTFTAELVDAKGVLTRAWQLAANHLLDKHGLEIKLIRK